MQLHKEVDHKNSESLKIFYFFSSNYSIIWRENVPNDLKNFQHLEFTAYG